MSVLRLYTDAALTDMISSFGTFTNPDQEDSLDGTNGETGTAALFLAVEQTTLSAEIGDTESTAVSLAAPRFTDINYPVIIVDSEKMRISSGNGTTGLSVIRGYDGTMAATHASGAAVRLCYDCTSISIGCVDSIGTDESDWVTYCNDSEGSPDGIWEAPHTVTDLNHDGKADLWRRVIVPAGTTAQYKCDLAHRIIATINEHRVS